MNLSVILCSLVCRLLLCLLRPASSLCTLCRLHVGHMSAVCSASNGDEVFGHDSKQMWVWDAAVAATEEKACLHNPACMNKVCVVLSSVRVAPLPFHAALLTFSFYPLCRFCLLFGSSGSASCGLFRMLLSHLLFFICLAVVCLQPFLQTYFSSFLCCSLSRFAF